MIPVEELSAPPRMGNLIGPTGPEPGGEACRIKPEGTSCNGALATSYVPHRFTEILNAYTHSSSIWDLCILPAIDLAVTFLYTPFDLELDHRDQAWLARSSDGMPRKARTDGSGFLRVQPGRTTKRDETGAHGVVEEERILFRVERLRISIRDASAVRNEHRLSGSSGDSARHSSSQQGGDRLETISGTCKCIQEEDCLSSAA